MKAELIHKSIRADRQNGWFLTYRYATDIPLSTNMQAAYMEIVGLLNNCGRHYTFFDLEGKGKPLPEENAASVPCGYTFRVVVCTNEIDPNEEDFPETLKTELINTRSNV